MSDKEIFNLFLDELYKIPIGAHGILIGIITSNHRLT